MISKDTRIKIHYRSGHVIDYLRYSGQHGLISLYNADVAFALKGACKLSTYQLNTTIRPQGNVQDYTTLDHLLAYDIYLSFKYQLGFKWVDYRVLGVNHVCDDLFILDVSFSLRG